MLNTITPSIFASSPYTLYAPCRKVSLIDEQYIECRGLSLGWLLLFGQYHFWF